MSFWVHPSGISKPVDIMVSPDMARSLTDQLDEVRIPHVKLIPNLEKCVNPLLNNLLIDLYLGFALLGLLRMKTFHRQPSTLWVLSTGRLVPFSRVTTD